MMSGPAEHILLTCRRCGRRSWAEQQDVLPTSSTGTWLQCPHCNRPLGAPLVCKNTQKLSRADGGCLKCEADAGEACRASPTAPPTSDGGER